MIWLFIRLDTTTGANCFARSTASTRSAKPTFAVWPNKLLFRPTVPWELSKPRSLLRRPINKEVRNENSTYAYSLFDLDSRQCGSSAIRGASQRLATDHHSSFARVSSARTQTH